MVIESILVTARLHHIALAIKVILGIIAHRIFVVVTIATPHLYHTNKRTINIVIIVITLHVFIIRHVAHRVAKVGLAHQTSGALLLLILSIGTAISILRRKGKGESTKLSCQRTQCSDALVCEVEDKGFCPTDIIEMITLQHGAVGIGEVETQRFLFYQCYRLIEISSHSEELRIIIEAHLLALYEIESSFVIHLNTAPYTTESCLHHAFAIGGVNFFHLSDMFCPTILVKLHCITQQVEFVVLLIVGHIEIVFRSFTKGLHLHHLSGSKVEGGENLLIGICITIDGIILFAY